MKYSIEIGKIVEGSLKHDQTKVINYTKQLIEKLKTDGENRAADKFNKILSAQPISALSTTGTRSDMLVPVDTESRSVLADVIYPSENNANVILSKRNLEDLQSFILSYKSADKLNALGIGVSNTLLLYGPPGCGKTQCAYYIAKELQLPLVIARLDSLISSYLGTTAKNIRTLFEFSQKVPCVLFLDEFDAIAKARDDSNELGELKRVVNSLLQNVDSMSQDSLLLAATNHDALLDSAVWRRFEYKLEIDHPDIDAILMMIDLFTQNSSGLNEKEKKDFAIALNGLTGANIEEVLVKALRNAIIKGKVISKKDYYEELFKFSGLLDQGNYDDKNALKIKAQFLRKCDEKVFSFQTIAEILDTSKTTVSKLIKDVGINEGT